MVIQVTSGKSAPLGASVQADGVNFSIYSRDADLVELLLFDDIESASPSNIISLSSNDHHTYHYWHTFVAGIKAGQVYAYRAHGPYVPESGLRFDGKKLLLDPYGLAVGIPEQYSRAQASAPGDNTSSAMKSVVANPHAYDWEGDEPLRRPKSESVIYELHVRGFTQHESSGVIPERRGTFAGLIEKIPYLKDLGITAIELLPIFQFDAQDAPTGLVNYWGYQPISFFAPHVAYSSIKTPLGALDEFRDLVKALHRAGIEVILDVVFNHTTEGGDGGPTLCYRGLANDAYYMLDPVNRDYLNYSGCGNTLNANKSIVRRMIQDSLRYWVSEMHVDGFRFDLASILTRDAAGQPEPNPPVLWDIESDPLLAGTKLIAEAWDAAGLYQVGHFVGDAWLEWNGKFRDDVRSFMRGDNATVSLLASRILGSPDIFGHEEREVEESINFITCHDGFTLNDLVSYKQKHNEENLENNRDGLNENLSWNCGSEGPTQDRKVEQLRNRQVKNLLVVQMLAAGLPMLLMGDEVRRTQQGNNNAYCQDNEISWFDWQLLNQHADVHRFVSLLCAYRTRKVLPADVGAITLNQLLESTKIKWHGVKLNQPDWSPTSHALAIELQSQRGTHRIHAIFNSYWEPLLFEIPPSTYAPLKSWHRCIDTSLSSPDDIHLLTDAPMIVDTHYLAGPRSVVVLVLAN